MPEIFIIRQKSKLSHYIITLLICLKANYIQGN